jgi:hypothetical protein
MGEGEDSGQCSRDDDLAAAPLRTGRNFESIDKRADGLDYLHVCCVMLQRLVEFGNFFAVEVRKVRMDCDFTPVVEFLDPHRSLAFEPPSAATDHARSQGRRHPLL